MFTSLQWIFWINEIAIDENKRRIYSGSSFVSQNTEKPICSSLGIWSRLNVIDTVAKWFFEVRGSGLVDADGGK